MPPHHDADIAAAAVYDISRALEQQGTPLSATAVREVLATQGFAPLPRRLDEERPVLVGPSTEAVADVRSFALAPREFTTRMAGYSCSSPIWCMSSSRRWRSPPGFPGRA